MNFERSSGIFLHPTSVPGNYGIGSLGEEAYQFIDFLKSAGQSLWQICPLGPTGYGDSPYQCFSAFAGNPLLISLEKLVEDGLLDEKDLESDIIFDKEEVEYAKVINFKYPLLREAFKNFDDTSQEKEAVETFIRDNREWLEDYALFMALKEHFNGKPWSEWEDDIKFRKSKAIDKYKEKLEDEMAFQSFIQYLFFKQWGELKEYANEKGIEIIGDIPIFVAMDSADAWANPQMFFFDQDLKPTQVAGVPPDYFSETGQLWGNPLYNWDKLKENDYRWWIKRFKNILDLVDIVRIDHFRGFAAYWAIPYGQKTAINGEWQQGPGKDLFKKIKEELGELPIIVEDLGVMTADVEELRDYFEFPGMKILQFAFDTAEENDYLPENYTENCIVYTGTHDNNTTLGWYDEDASKEDKQKINKYLDENLEIRHENIVWDLLELAWSSKAVFALAPLQDILSLDSDARFNIPGVAGGNWQWKYKSEMLSDWVINRLKGMTDRNNR